MFHVLHPPKFCEAKIVAGKSFKFQEKGFSILEMMTAIFIILIGLSGISGVISKIIPVSGLSSLYFGASYLAQEGIELIRNIRDENLIKLQDWDNGLEEDDWRVQYNKNILLPFYDVFLKIDSDGFYNYYSGNNTPFKRKITIQKIDNSTFLVTAEVTFSFRGETYNFSAEEYLYQWTKLK